MSQTYISKSDLFVEVLLLAVDFYIFSWFANYDSVTAQVLV